MPEIIRALSRVRAPAMQGEYDIHALISAALESAGIACEHEHRLGARARIDFMCSGIGVEIKKSKPDRRALLKQLERYAAFEELRGIIVVLPRDTQLPDAINGKKIACVSLNRLWGIALP